MVKIRDLNNRDYRTLLVFEKSLEWLERIQIVVEVLPDNEWTLKKKMLRASSKIPAYIANGISQFYLTVEREAYGKALNKAKEAQGILKLMFESGFIDEQEYKDINDKADEIGKLLNAMRKKATAKIEG
jgi:four helix bundle protein